MEHVLEEGRHGHKEEQVEVCDGHRRTHSWTQTLGGNYISVAQSRTEMSQWAVWAWLWQTRTSKVRALEQGLTQGRRGRMSFGSACEQALAKKRTFGRRLWLRWDTVSYPVWNTGKTNQAQWGIYWGQQRLWGRVTMRPEEGVLGNKRIPSGGSLRRTSQWTRPSCPLPPARILEEKLDGLGACTSRWNAGWRDTGCSHAGSSSGPALSEGMAVFRVTAPGA